MAAAVESFPHDHFRRASYDSIHRTHFGTSMVAVSGVLTIIPLVCCLLKGRNFVLSPQLLAMFIGIMMVVAVHCFPILGFESIFVNAYNILAIYYTLMIVKFIYALDSYIFLKSLSHILVISLIGWIVFAMCFGFLLIAFAGGLKTLSFIQLCLVGFVFTPIEMPSVMIKIEQIKLIEVLMTSESVLTTLFSMTALNLVFGGMNGLFSHWYQPVFVLMRMVLGAIPLGTCIGLLAGYVIPRYCSNCVHTMLMIITSNFLLYYVAQFVLGCSGAICCFLYMILISRKRLELPEQLDKDIIVLIDVLFYIVSTVVSFAVIFETMPHFISAFTVMASAISLALYICANACRLVFFICISPLLSRLGYGFNFRTLVMMVWCVKKGPMSFVMLALVIAESNEEVAPRNLMVLGLNYLILINCLNEFTSLIVVKRMVATGDDLLVTRTNMRNAFRYLEQKRANQLAVMRMHRFYTEANWRLINEHTLITPLVIDQDAKVLGGDGMAFEQMPPFCDSCKKVVAYKPSKREYHEMLIAVRLRVLHAAKMSFLRQFKHGFLDIAALRALNHSVNMAMESKESNIKIDPLINLMQEKPYSKYIEKVRMQLFTKYASIVKTRYKPRHPKLYALTSHWLFCTFFDVLTLIQFILTIVTLSMASGLNMELCYFLCLLLFYLEMTLKIIECESLEKHDGYKRYIKDKWNKLEFSMIVLGTADLFFTFIAMQTDMYWVSRSKLTFTIITNTIRVFRCTRLVRIIRLVRFVPKLQMSMMTHFDSRTDAKLRHAYSIGRGVVVSYEEVDEMLHTFSDEPKIVTHVREELQEDRNRIAKELGLIELLRPRVIMALKTRQAMMCTNTTMRNAVHKLRMEGLIDTHEHIMLQEVVAERWKAIVNNKTIGTSGPKQIFAEIPWIGGDMHLFEFFYDNVKLRVWDAGEVIYMRGDVAEGVYILVTGMFKIMYEPSDTTLHDLAIEGLLPVKDLIHHALFDYPTEEFIFKGSSLGELSVLTGRPYCCNVIAEIPTQAFIIPSELITEAMMMTPDPVDGLYSRIWKHVTYNLVKRLLKEVPAYYGASSDDLNASLARSFVPKLDAFDLFRTNDSIEDIVLLEGCVTDFISNEIFIAPCVVSRGSPALVLPDNNVSNPFDCKPKLWIVPVPIADKYDVMKSSEEVSNLNYDAASDCFLLRNQTFKRWLMSRFRRNSRLSRISGILDRSVSKVEMSIHQMLASSQTEMEYNNEYFVEDANEADRSASGASVSGTAERRKFFKRDSTLSAVSSRKRKRDTSDTHISPLSHISFY